MAASLLLAATIKMHGALVLQIQGRGALKLLVVECTRQVESEDFTLRATAKFNDEFKESTLLEMIGGGQFVITLDPKDGGVGYQGIVPLEGENIAKILENYMRRSEQIDTSIWLACDGEKAAGMLLQKLPGQQETDLDAWTRTNLLADTVQSHELLALTNEDLLGRLFDEEDVRIYQPYNVRFLCSCSRDSVSNMLRMLGEEEIKSIIEERGELEVHCDFCNQHYRFDKVDSEQLFVAEITAPGTKSRH